MGTNHTLEAGVALVVKEDKEADALRAITGLELGEDDDIGNYEYEIELKGFCLSRYGHLAYGRGYIITVGEHVDSYGFLIDPKFDAAPGRLKLSKLYVSAKDSFVGPPKPLVWLCVE